MEILLDVEELWEITNNGWGECFKEDEEQQIKNVLQIDGIKKVARVNIGPGADLLTVLIVINTILDTYLVASKILEGSEAWKKLIGKLKEYISKKQMVSIDEEGAKILAINYIYEHYSYNSIELIDTHVINIGGMPCNHDTISELARKPHNYYIQTYCTNENRIILGIRSDGEVLLIKEFELNSYGLTEIKKS